MASKTPALNVLDAAGVSYRLLSYEAGNDHFGAHAVEELEIDPTLALKTLVVANKGEFGVCCVPISARLSLKKAARALGWKTAALSDPKDAQRVTGYIVGGISPFGQKTALPTFVSNSVKDAELITVSAGARGLSVEISPQQLIDHADGTFADLEA
ncbi:Cys-tRNA(Pro) deacylase [Corynebacterium aquatimens]|uniref:Cys-tRNA(Pro)/Cys-tRNA(Cys) deacylase n=1 Tax=Corynebacterium aquatimens TaxID=1190508 RepID=A0A931E679_9CORY|nr:Cys-tRNA(Pro) deacylase [Corynebacterium aquatimens]MBG6123168.1 Cys-tRNA(Pro)/Cys-tRNA(Cys) deacylase [Corynebacterium aquatimens]WJY66501.1 Cys-tRNA(Pro)/Cys-tRNA(Cys) deacylase YbaK [Corynebacterium aquatimens]